MVHDKKIILRDVWRTCNKIRAAIFRTKGLNLYEYFRAFDPKGNCVVKESEFISIFANQLKNAIGLSDQEILDLADYFRIQDGRILYTQLCDVIHTKEPNFEKNEDIVSGLEWDDPLHVNRISQTEQRRLCLLIAKIATAVNMRRLILRPYFQDYELVAKNIGCVTIAHFARILSFLNLLVSPADFNLLVKKYIKDSYTINYVAFLKDIDESVKYMDENGMLDIGGDLHTLFPGRILNAELPKLPRPEIGHISPAGIFGIQNVFHPVLSARPEQEALLNVIYRIQRHVSQNLIRVKYFFQAFDPLHSGRCTISQFRRAIDAMGISKLGRLHITPEEFESLTIQYRDPCDPNRICYDTFETDIESVFTTRELEKYPNVQVNTPRREVMELPRKGGANWANVNVQRKELCEDALDKVKRKTLSRRILLKPAFRDYDAHNNGHCSRSQMRQVLLSNGILLTGEELYALEERYNDDVGFNFSWFLSEIDSRKVEQPLYNKYVEVLERINTKPPEHKPEKIETDIVQILAKIKAKVIRERVRPMEFFEKFDRHRELVISKVDFKRALDVCRFDLTETECDTLMEVFASPGRPNYIEYKKFSEVVEESLTQSSLERSPLVVPLQHIPTRDSVRNFLNFEERRILSMAMQKLSKACDIKSNVLELFKDYDPINCGTITKNQFLKVLAIRDMMKSISMQEFDIVCKCFSFERGLRDEVDYRGFCKTLDLLFETAKQLPF